MSKEKVRDIKSAKAFAESVADVPLADHGDKEMVSAAPATPATPPVSTATLPKPQEKMIDQDRMTLELAKSRKDTVEAQAKEALAKKETADLAYRYIVLQLYMKYGLTAADAISENGDIIRGGAVPQGQTS